MIETAFAKNTFFHHASLFFFSSRIALVPSPFMDFSETKQQCSKQSHYLKKSYFSLSSRCRKITKKSKELCRQTTNQTFLQSTVSHLDRAAKSNSRRLRMLSTKTLKSGIEPTTSGSFFRFLALCGSDGGSLIVLPFLKFLHAHAAHSSCGLRWTVGGGAKWDFCGCTECN